jgi:NAD(P) transhydrogenase subunit alpha
MRIAIAKEIAADERRVALIPDTVSRFVKQGFEVWVESGAGEAAHFSNQAYIDAGAIIVSTPETVYSADLVLKVKPPQEMEDGRHEADLCKPGTTLISFLDPLGNPAISQKLAERQVTAFSMELIPRISRAQSMDALSSQASIAGYKAVLIAAAACPKFFPMLTTAAGTIPPAKVFIIGAGVAGLQAIATARRLGAVVEAFDIRPAVKEEVQSLGAKFVEVALEEETVAAGGYAKEVSETAKQKTQAAIEAHVKQADIVITTAQVPGRKAPVLVTADMIAAMKPGAVVVDMAAEQGGNCAGTQAGRQIVENDVMIIGPVNLPATMPVHASQMYSKNLLTLIQHLVKDGQFNFDFEDEITRESCVTHAGQIRHQRVQELLNNAVAVGS